LHSGFLLFLKLEKERKGAKRQHLFSLQDFSFERWETSLAQPISRFVGEEKISETPEGNKEPILDRRRAREN